MSVVLLDGSRADAPESRYVRQRIEGLGLPLTDFALANMTLAPCLGDFECWTKTPGRCRTRDGAQDIARAVQSADLVIFLTPIRFGGYSAALKKAVDRLIGMVHPYFHARDGITRHRPRYARYPAFLFIGIADRPSEVTGAADQAATFARLTLGNAVNLIAPGYLAHVIDPADADWPGRLDEALLWALRRDLITPAAVPQVADLLAACAAEASAGRAGTAPRSVAVLVGSARPKGTSTSEWLADRLIGGLEAAGCQVRKVYASQFIKAGRACEQALDDMLGAELLIVAAPIYVDGLPYLVVSALEQLTARLGVRAGVLARVAGVLNCGYPEAEHNHLALNMLRHFARQAGLRWAGGLGLGGGEALQGSLRRHASIAARHVVHALTLSASALGAGQALPEEASQLMARPLVPARLYRWLARMHWNGSARAHGLTRARLSEQPWQDETGTPG